jgi:hypothetical protein
MTEMPSAPQALNAFARFALELCALAALAYWGFSTGDGLGKILLGLGVPLLVVLVWGTFGSPGAPFRAAAPLRLALLAVIFGWAVIGLWQTGHQVLALLLAAAAVLNTALLRVLGQD